MLAGFGWFRATAGPSDYLMDLWTSDDDLPDSSVAAIAQTPDGYLWIGTHNGLVRFDGVRFATFDPANTPALKHARVVRLYTDAQGTLWINTYDGSVTSFRDGLFTHEWEGAEVVGLFSTSNQVYLATLDNGMTTRAINGSNQWQRISYDDRRNAARYFAQDPTGTIWCLLNSGVIKRINGTNLAQLPTGLGLDGEKVNYLTTAPDGHIWVGTDKKMLEWDGSHFEDQTPTNGEPEVAVTFVFCTATNGLWAFANNSVRHAVNRRWIASVDSWNDLVQATPIYVRAYEERNGNVWFREYGHGLFCAGADGQFSRISTTNGLPDNRVSSWFQDREGNLWVGVDRGGLVRLRKRYFQTVGGESLKNVAVSSVCEDNQSNVWIGTFDHGFDRWHDGQLEHFDLPEGATRNAVVSICSDQHGRVWLSGGHEDLFCLESNRISRGDTTLHGIKSILADSQGRIWIGRQYQLACLTNGKALNFTANNGFTRRDVRALAEDRQGVIWIGMGNGVLYKYENDKFTSYTPDGASENQAIWSLLPDDDGSIWAGTFRGGLLRFKDGKFTRYTTENGLPNDVICQILDDGLGKLWLGSYRGIFYVPKQAFNALDAGQIRLLPCTMYGLYDGLPTLECSGNYQPSAWCGHDGTLWFGTVKGLVAVRPGIVQPNLLPPPVTLEQISVDEKEFPRTNPLRIPPGKHQLDFQFTAPSFTAPDKVRFRYRLMDFDDAWVESGGKRSAHYGPLPPGKYTFQVIACNNDGVWNQTGASLAITQLPFFWQTWWFEVLAIASVVILISAAVRRAATRNLRHKLERLRQQRAVERERERIAKDIHDDLGAGLTQIMLQSSLAQREPPGQMQTDLGQISETARDLVRTMDEIVWAVDPENDTLDGLVTYIGKYVQDFSMAAKLRCRLDLPLDPPAITVSA